MPRKKKPDPYQLDTYEQEIEDNFNSLKPSENQEELISALKKAAQEHAQKKKPITIRLSIEDLDAIKVKAAKLGIPYQTYLNIIIHKDATSQ